MTATSDAKQILKSDTAEGVDDRALKNAADASLISFSTLPLGGKIGAVVLLLFFFIGLATLFMGILRSVSDVPMAAYVELKIPEGPAPSQAKTLLKSTTVPNASIKAAATIIPDNEPQEESAVIPKGHRISIILVESGLDVKATQRAIRELPSAVVLAFSPYASNVSGLVKDARSNGHQIWVGVPMEPLRYPAVDPGENTLLIRLSEAENLKRLSWAIGRVNQPVGVYNLMGSAFTANKKSLLPILKTLSERKLMFLDTRATPRSKASEIAASLSLPIAINDRFLDSAQSEAAIDRELRALEAQARLTGYAVGVGQPQSALISRLATWLPTLSDRGFILVPPSDTTHTR